jgi:outer membrane protein TolC
MSARLCALGIALIATALARGHAAETEQPRLDLRTYLADVEAASPAIIAARRRAEATARRVTPAGSPSDPFLAIGPDDIPTSGGSPGLIRYQLSQAIPFPGKLGAAARGAADRADAAAADAETITREVRVSAVQAFYRAFHNQRSIELVGDLRRLVDEAVSSGKARYETGSPNHHEWLLARADLGVLDTERERLDTARIALRAELNELRNRAADTQLGELRADELFQPGPAAPDLIAETPASPEIRSLDALLQAIEADRRAARLAYLPDFVVQGMAEQPRGTGMEESESMWGAMVGINLPVFWRWKQDELVAAAEREREAAIAERQALENRLRAEQMTARRELETAKQVVELYEKNVIPLTDLAFDSARMGYALGRVSLSDLIAAARARRTQQLELLAARIDVALARTRLENPLSSPPVLRLAPSTPTLFGTGMGGTMAPAMPAGTAPSAVRFGSGMGLGAGRGSPPPKGGTTSGMGGM